MNEPEQPKRPQFRLTVEQKEEIAEATAQRLAKDPRFQRRVIWKIIGATALSLILFGCGTLFYLANRLGHYVEQTDLDVSNRVFIAKQEVTNRIAAQFETVRIKEIVSEVASNRANELLTKQIEPELRLLRSIVSNELQSVSKDMRSLSNTFVESSSAISRGLAKEKETIHSFTATISEDLSGNWTNEPAGVRKTYLAGGWPTLILTSKSDPSKPSLVFTSDSDSKTFSSNTCHVTADAQLNIAQFPPGFSTTMLPDYDTIQIWCFFPSQLFRPAQAVLTSATVKFLEPVMDFWREAKGA